MANVESSSFGTNSKYMAQVIASHLEELARIIREDPSKIVEFERSVPVTNDEVTTTLRYKK